MHYKCWYIGSILQKAWWRLNTVETCCLKCNYIIQLLCLTGICIWYEFEKYKGMTNVKIISVDFDVTDVRLITYRAFLTHFRGINWNKMGHCITSFIDLRNPTLQFGVRSCTICAVLNDKTGTEETIWENYFNP